MTEATDTLLANRCRPPLPSRVTVPAGANPHAKLVFALMRDHCVTYDELEYRSGLLRSTIKAWRTASVPSLTSIEAALGSFGWTLVPVPPLADMKPETLEKLEEISLDFVSDNAALAAVMALVCKVPTRSFWPTYPERKSLPGTLVTLKSPIGSISGLMVRRGAPTLATATGLRPDQLAQMHPADVFAVAAQAVGPFDQH